MKILFIFISILMGTSANAQNFRKRAKDKSFNPKIGINATFLDQSSERDATEDGFSLSEVEMQFTSDIDAYFAGTILIGIEQEDSGEYGIAPEEVFVETISIPNFTFKLGKSKMPLGRHNQLHPHAYPFVNAPLINENILGDEGLTEVGYGVSGLLPFTWFSELNLNYVQGDNEDLFGSDRKKSKVIVGRFKNMWELSDAATFEFGVSGAKGENKDHRYTALAGVDMTFKWRPTKGGKYQSLEWGTEYLEKDRKGATDGELSGVVSYIKYQFKERWFAQYRYDYLGLNDPEAFEGIQRHTGLLTFVPSEFSAVRLQYENIDDDKTEDEKKVSLQLIISLGAHPAHTY
jgi:hypothetical protein